MQRRTLAAAVIAAAALTLAGCASLPSPEAMKTETANYQLPKQPEAGKAMVYVVRPSGAGGLVRFNVFLDDQQPASEMGYTRSSQYIHFNVAPGPHKIYSKAENWSELEVQANAGDVIFVEQELGFGVIMARNTLLKLDDVSGKYHVKKLTLGTVIKTDK